MEWTEKKKNTDILTAAGFTKSSDIKTIRKRQIKCMRYNRSGGTEK